MNQVLLFSLCAGVGGFFGAFLRHFLSYMFKNNSLFFPISTFIANIVGCFLLGILIYIFNSDEAISPYKKILLTTGFCGGLTTLSSFVYELICLVKDKEYFPAGLYFLSTIILSLLFFNIGYYFLKFCSK